MSHFLSLLEDCDNMCVLFYRHEDVKSILFILEGGVAQYQRGVAGRPIEQLFEKT